MRNQNGALENNDGNGFHRRYSVSLSERAEAEREGIHLNLIRQSPQYAGEWLSGFDRRIYSLIEFPGPLSHPQDQQASALYNATVRRALYYGPTNRRGKNVWRILSTILPMPTPNESQIIRVLRVLHGARPLIPPPSDDADEANPV